MASFLTLLLLGCGGDGGGGDAQPEIHLDGSWARAMPVVSGEGEAPTNSAVYFHIRNDGRAEDRLVGASSQVADRAEIHESKIVNDMMVMEEQDGLDIPAGSFVELKPAGLHVMLLGLRRPLLVGEEFELLLEFEKSGELSIVVPVRSNAGG
jgi:copper(I)-binding protein